MASNGYAKLKSQRKFQFTRWKPQRCDRYYLILGDGEIKSFLWNDTPFDTKAWEWGNCFRLRKDAERAKEAIEQLLLGFHAGLGQ